MFPILLTIGRISISSYGVFLALAFLLSLFLIWRLSRAWDLNEEKVLDLTILTFFGGLIGARIYFVLNHPGAFSNFLNILLFNKVPGFSFWGSFLGAWLTLYFFSKRQRFDFWMAADIASVGFIGGLILSNIGCFLGGCNVGIPSKLFLAVNMVGEIGKRIPVQAMEALLLFLVLRNLWVQTTHFHQRGKILALSLIYIGIIKLLMEPLKASHDEGIYLSAALVILGVNIFYKISKRRLVLDAKELLKYMLSLFNSPESRKQAMAAAYKYWYNQKTQLFWGLRNLKRAFSLKKNLRRINVRISYKNNKLYQK